MIPSSLSEQQAGKLLDTPRKVRELSHHMRRLTPWFSNQTYIMKDDLGGVYLFDIIEEELDENHELQEGGQRQLSSRLRL